MYRLNEHGENALKEWLKSYHNTRKSLGLFIAEVERKADEYLEDYGYVNMQLDKHETSQGIKAILTLQSNCFTRIE